MAYQNPKQDYGVAPDWEAIDVSTADDTPTGNCIGFYVEVAGDIAFTTSNGNTVTVAVGDTSYHMAHVTTFKNSGTTATGIFALNI